MTALLFLLALAAVLGAWIGLRRLSLTAALVTILLAVAWFYHHVTDPLNIDL